MSLHAALGRFLCCIGLHRHLSFCAEPWLFKCAYCGHRLDLGPPKPLALPEGFLFDWLRDYGPMWEPGSTAFWLEPETCDELASWQNKYRPTEYGLVVVSDDVRIEWIEPVPDPYAKLEAEYVRRASNLHPQQALHNASVLRNMLQSASQQSNDKLIDDYNKAMRNSSLGSK